MIDLAVDLLLVLLVLSAALAAILGRDLFTSIVFFIVYGLFVSLAWVRLDAVNVALAEAAIGAGLTGVLLVGAAARLWAAGAEGDPAEGRTVAAIAALTMAGLAALLVWALLALDPAAEGLTRTVAGRLAQAGVENPVTAVLLNFRAWDTLLESIVLLAALLGVWLLCRDGDWPGPPGLRQHVRPDGVLATFGRSLPPIGLMIGVYLVWRGADAPGGAFQGGTVLAAVWLLVALAGRADPPEAGAGRLRLALVAGPAVFLAVGLAGAFLGGFLVIPEAEAKPVILGIEAALTLSIAVTLALLVLGPPSRGAPERRE